MVTWFTLFYSDSFVAFFLYVCSCEWVRRTYTSTKETVNITLYLRTSAWPTRWTLGRWHRIPDTYSKRAFGSESAACVIYIQPSMWRMVIDLRGTTRRFSVTYVIGELKTKNKNKNKQFVVALIYCNECFDCVGYQATALFPRWQGGSCVYLLCVP